MRILVPYIATFPGGVRTMLGAGLPRVAALPGLEITYAELCGNEEDMDALERSGVPVERALGIRGPSVLSARRGWRRLRDLLAHAPRMARLARRLADHLPAYDVCWVHGHRELLVAAAARALVRGRGPAIVWHWHGPPLSLGGERGSLPERTLCAALSRRCERIIAISAFCAAQTARMGVPPSRVVTVQNAARVEDAGGASGPALPDRPPGAFVSLVACAAIRPHKGVHVAVEALRHLPGHHLLWVTGDVADPLAQPYLARLRSLAEEARVAERVRFVGRRRDLHRVMAHADAVVVPSIWEEPFGLVAAEAQLVGVPVVASCRGALPEILDGGRLGLLFDPADPAALAAALVRLEARTLRESIVEAALREAPERHSYERWSREVAAVLGEAARERAGRPRDQGDGAPSTTAPGLSRTANG